MGMVNVHVGLDDTDSKRGMCTTYLASLLIPALLDEGTTFIDYPNLIRLNPNIPWKTRGNAAISLRLLIDKPENIFQKVWGIVSRYADAEQSDPGVVILKCNTIPPDVKAFGELALHHVVKKNQALKLIREHNGYYNMLGNGRGVIGALAAIGNTLNSDYTYELIAYRSLKEKSKDRGVNEESVVKMSRETYPQTFNNYDPESKRVLITPRGPDPVLFGVRGESAEVVLKAASMVKTSQNVERYTIFRTNQGTGLHLTRPITLKPLKPYVSGYIVGTVSQKPIISRGGHVYFKVECEGEDVCCAVYEPAGSLKKKAARLILRDVVEVGGGVRRKSTRYPRTINVEYIKILKLASNIHYKNPVCRVCGRRMVSEGRGKGYRCPHCGFKDKSAEKIIVEQPREIQLGLYLPPPHSQRHLTKPFQRFGIKKKHDFHLIKGWFGFGKP